MTAIELTAVQINFARAAMQRYVDLRTKFGYAAPLTGAEVDHSALLGRLLSGKEPFPQPPPLDFSYPWYELLENGRDDHCDVHGPYQPDDRAPYRSIIVNQSVWRLIEQKGEDDFIATYRDGAPAYRVYWATDGNGPFGWTVELIPVTDS